MIAARFAHFPAPCGEIALKNLSASSTAVKLVHLAFIIWKKIREFESVHFFPVGRGHFIGRGILKGGAIYLHHVFIYAQPAACIGGCKQLIVPSALAAPSYSII